MGNYAIEIYTRAYLQICVSTAVVTRLSRKIEGLVSKFGWLESDVEGHKGLIWIEKCIGDF